MKRVGSRLQYMLLATGRRQILYLSLSSQSLQSEAAQRLPLLQTGALLRRLHLGLGPQAVRQHPQPAAPGPEDRLLLPEDRQCLAQGLSVAALRHLHSRRER